MQRGLLFHNPVFNKGLNVTVRNGIKWMQVDIGDTLSLMGTDQNGNVLTNVVGTVVGKALLPVKLMPDNFFLYEHDPECRNLAGLLAEMKKTYSDFSEDSIVTVLLFNIQNPSQK